MILTVLKQHYPNEYEMLKFLALGDRKSFDFFSTSDPAYTEHLAGYGIIELQGDEYVFRVDAVKEFLAREARFQRLNLSNEDKWAEISERRNKLEPQLRLLCRNMLQVFFGSSDAKSKVLDILGKARSTSLASLEYSDLFSPEKGLIYFEDLRKVISKYWDCFKNIIGPDQNKVLRHLEFINEFRADAHAKQIAEDDFQMARLSFTFFEDKLKEFTG
jgi:sugar-specific transcriptional regulator TrmB